MMEEGPRSSLPEKFIKNGVLKRIAKFTEKHLRRSIHLIKLQAAIFLY